MSYHHEPAGAINTKFNLHLKNKKHKILLKNLNMSFLDLVCFFCDKPIELFEDT